MSGLDPALPIRTERLLLRPHRPEDLDDLVRFHSDPEVVRYVPWLVRDRAATEETLQVKLGFAFASPRPRRSARRRRRT